MSFSYDLADFDTELNRLRLEIGDTDSDDYFLDDEEIAVIQSEKTSFYRRAAACCGLICAKVARDVNFKIGHFSENSDKIYAHYEELMDKFNIQASTSYPWSAAISVSEKDLYENDESLVHPKIKLGLHDHP